MKDPKDKHTADAFEEQLRDYAICLTCGKPIPALYPKNICIECAQKPKPRMKVSLAHEKENEIKIKGVGKYGITIEMGVALKPDQLDQFIKELQYAANEIVR